MKTQNQSGDPAGIYLFKSNSGKTKTVCERNLSKVNKDTRRSSVIFIVNLEYILHIGPVFSLLALNK